MGSVIIACKDSAMCDKLAHTLAAALANMCQSTPQQSVFMRQRLVEKRNKVIQLTLYRFFDKRQIIHVQEFYAKIVILFGLMKKNS